MEDYKKRNFCAICYNEELNEIFSYGEVPLAGDFPREEEIKNQKKYNLSFLFCTRCGLLQTDSIINPELLFNDYRYKSSIGLAGHFDSVSDMLIEKLNLDENSNILEIGCNDGPLLNPLAKKTGAFCVGIDPAENITSQVDWEDNITILNSYFDETWKNPHPQNENYDLIVSNNCFAHIENIQSVVRGIKRLLKKEGVFVFEVSYVKDLIDKLQYDNMYHEHIYYYSLNALNYLFKSNTMTPILFEEVSTHSGSVRVYVKNGKRLAYNDELSFMMGGFSERVYKEEMDWGLKELPVFRNFGLKCQNHAQVLSNLIKGISGKIVGYGASGRANMVCNASSLDSSLVNYIVDESPERHGRYTSGSSIPIVPKSQLDNDNPDYVIIFAWNFAEMIMEKLKDRDFKYIIPFPEPRIISSIEEL